MKYFMLLILFDCFIMLSGAMKLDNANSASIFSYKVDTIWEENDTPMKLPEFAIRDPFDELIFQLVPNEYYQLLGVRRGRSIQVYSTEDEVPIFLESVPNLFYGTKEYVDKSGFQKKPCSQNPLLCGFDFNPTFGPEIITIDENGVVRVSDFNQRYKGNPKNYFNLVYLYKS